MNNNEPKDSQFEQTLYVDGMHCSSCEILIEKKLIKHNGIKSVDASLKNGEVRIVKNFSEYLRPEELSREFESLGYKFSKSKFYRVPQPLFVKQNGKIKINPVKRKKLFSNIGLIVGLIFVFFVVENFQLGRYITIDTTATLGAFFLLGLAAGVSSCAALIGGLLLSLIKHWHEQYIDAESGLVRAKPHLLFHFGRILSFFVFGGVLGLIGDAITLNSTNLYVALVVGVSLLMIILALQMLDVSWANRLSPRLPKFITRAAAKDRKTRSMFAPFFTGALTFFLPCGFTLIAQGVALASGSFVFGALVMLYFAFGTLPTLAAISLSGLKFTSKPHLTARFSQIAGIIILFFALYNINGQLNVLGLPSLSDIRSAQSQYPEIESSQPTVANAGEQIISLVAKNFNYIPTSPTELLAGLPTKLVVDDQGILGCGIFISARGLFDGFVALKSGQNIIDLGTPRPGTYKITCSMGMVPPVTVTVK